MGTIAVNNNTQNEFAVRRDKRDKILSCQSSKLINKYKVKQIRYLSLVNCAATTRAIDDIRSTDGSKPVVAVSFHYMLMLGHS